jgi:hypothetical protein
LKQGCILSSYFKEFCKPIADSEIRTKSSAYRRHDTFLSSNLTGSQLSSNWVTRSFIYIEKSKNSRCNPVSNPYFRLKKSASLLIVSKAFLKSIKHAYTFFDDLKNVSCLLYADDLVLISESAIGLQNSLNILSCYCDKWKLTVNLDKTKIMIFNKAGRKLTRESFCIRITELILEWSTNI